MTYRTIPAVQLVGEQNAAAGLAELARRLFTSQRERWPLLEDACSELSRLQKRELSIQGCKIELQHNPARIVSTAAAVSSAAIKARPCFLCSANLPEQQLALKAAEDLYLLCNPRPIFLEHFTVISPKHCEQTMLGSEGRFLRCLELFGPEYAGIFNGAEAGASAPDHLHYQIFPVSALPLLQHSLKIVAEQSLQDGAACALVCFCGVFHLRLSAATSAALLPLLERALAIVHSNTHKGRLLNLIAAKQGDRLNVHVFPRSKHRPSCYFNSEAGYLISPAAVELGGTVVLPRHSDFERLSAAELADIYREVCWSEPDVAAWFKKLIGSTSTPPRH